MSEGGADDKERSAVLRHKFTCVCGTWAGIIFSLSLSLSLYLFRYLLIYPFSQEFDTISCTFQELYRLIRKPNYRILVYTKFPLEYKLNNIIQLYKLN